jgi:hypothetical protein
MNSTVTRRCNSELDDVDPAVSIAASGMIAFPAPQCERGHVCWPPSPLSYLPNVLWKARLGPFIETHREFSQLLRKASTTRSAKKSNAGFVRIATAASRAGARSIRKRDRWPIRFSSKIRGARTCP